MKVLTPPTVRAPIESRWSSESSRDMARLAAVGLSALMSAQLLRIFVPLVFEYGERSGTTAGALRAGVIALALSLSPLLLPLVRRLVGSTGSLPGLIVGLAAVRVILQFVHPIPLWLGGVGVGIALVALAELVAATRSRSDGGTWFVAAFIVGLAADTAVRAAFRTWDVGWQSGWLPSLVAIVPAIVLVSIVPFTWWGSAEGQPRGAFRVAAFGAFLFLQMLYAQNVAFVASSGRVSLAVATAVVLVGDAIALAAVSAIHRSARRTALAVAGLAMVALAYLLMQTEGWTVIGVALGVDVLSAPLAALALTTRSHSRQVSQWRVPSAFALGAFLFFLLVLLYQVAYRVKLPIANTALPPVAALLLTLGAVGAPVDVRRSARRVLPWVAAPLILLLVPLVMGLGGVPASAVGNGRSIRLVSFNVHMSFDQGGQLDPEAIAVAIEAHRPDVVAMQEIPRGWLGAGGIDLAQWLAHRLDMHYAFSRAADRQFGNVVLSRLPIERSTRAVLLPHVSSAMHRSYLAAVIDIGRGRSITVIDAHLEGDRSDQPVQVAQLLRTWKARPNVVIAGDMNFDPSDRSARLFRDAGLASAQDLSGQGAVSTATHPKHPHDRPDWIFGTLGVRFSRFQIGASPSDHRPLIVTVTES